MVGGNGGGKWLTSWQLGRGRGTLAMINPSRHATVTHLSIIHSIYQWTDSSVTSPRSHLCTLLHWGISAQNRKQHPYLNDNGRTEGPRQHSTPFVSTRSYGSRKLSEHHQCQQLPAFKSFVSQVMNYYKEAKGVGHERWNLPYTEAESILLFRSRPWCGCCSTVSSKGLYKHGEAL